MSVSEDEHTFINRPVPEEYTFEYHPPPPPSNPVLRGLPLYYLAQLVASSGLVQNVLWSSNGFGKLRDRPELHDVDPRYVPDVIRTSNVPRPLTDGEYLLSISREPWATKGPAESVLKSCVEYREAYESGKFTPLDVVEALLPLVRREGKEVSRHATAFLCVEAELVRKAAEASTERWRAGKPLSPIDGVVMAVKDEEDLAGHTRSVGTTLDFRRKDDATSYCVQKWLDAGAICLGKTNMHEMGMDTTNNNIFHGTPVNPNNDTYYCGGSSGGSAYAVAAGLVPFTMGNDGGGSVRIPAAYCGLFGLKTSHGRISVRPSCNLARSNGVPGPIAANMVDLDIAYRVMAEPDARDPASALFAPPASPSSQTAGQRRKVLGIYKQWFDRADAPVRETCQAAVDHLTSKLGYTVVDITLPMIHEGQLAHAMTIMAEIAAGTTDATLAQLSPANKILLSLAKKTPGVDLLQAQKLRHVLMRHLAHLYARHRGMVVVTPTTPNAGWHFHPADLKYGCSDGNTQIRNMEYAWLANFSGCPALTAPVGYLDPAAGAGEGRIPVGLMGMGEWCSEDELIGFGYDVEGYLDGVVGRARPRGAVDVFGLVGGK